MENINYWTVFLFMTIESSFIPFPSEIVVPPAAWKAAQGDLNVILVAVVGTLGSIAGAVFNYYFALFLGRKVIYSLADTRWAHLMLIDRKGVEKAEKFFVTYGKSSTFFCRLIPAIRQLISLPAGLARMHFGSFLFFTALGSGIWNIILALLGYYLYSQKALLEKYYHELSYAGVALGVLFVLYIVASVRKKNRESRMDTQG
jgi:membrane protein DedA with SNARE-associated domain